MPILSSLPTDAPSQLDNILTLGLVAVLALVVVIAVIRKAVSNKKACSVIAEPVENPVLQAPQPTAPGSAGGIKLYSVEPKTAAMVMAIVADKMGKPLNELRFISIKEVK